MSRESLIRLFVVAVIIVPAALLTTSRSSRADGSLPPLPYRYLHPPSALAATNTPPAAGNRSLPVESGYAAETFVFTTDGQAGVTGPARALAAPARATSVNLMIQPVETPPNLSSDLVVEGNAYRFSATARPVSRPVRIVRALKVTLRWPHAPAAVYLYQGGSWTRLCDSSHAVVTSTTISCLLTTSGTVVGVQQVAFSTPLSNTRFSYLNRFIPLLVVILLSLLAAGTALFFTRERSHGSKSGQDRA